MATKLARNDLFALERYAEARPEFRAKVIEHKKNRNVRIGEHVTLYFEDRLTTQYQIQEMLRVERIFEPQGIEDELIAYNPLIPDGANWKATFMVEFPDEDERRVMLRQLIGIEDRVYMQVDGHERVYPIADEDMDRSDEAKTSAVHFLRFELDADQIAALKGGAALAAGIDHDSYRVEISPVAENIRSSLVADLD